ncbi:hypothetical protein INR49_016641 [Caranx melampygus]|nr:hypothetical protein INR49_016641 [Caranx melampygus]
MDHLELLDLEGHQDLWVTVFLESLGPGVWLVSQAEGVQKGCGVAKVKRETVGYLESEEKGVVCSKSKDPVDLKAPKERRVSVALQDLMVTKEKRGKMVLPESRVMQELRVHWDGLELEDLWARREIQESPDSTELRVIQESQAYQETKGRKERRGLPGRIGSPGLGGEKGDMGFPGTPGVPGLNGLTGRKGDKGLGGVNGADGEPGVKGEKGTAGFPGFPGFKGSAGSPGRDGDEGPPGSPGPRGSTGPKGITGIEGAKGRKESLDSQYVEEVKELVTQEVVEKCGLEYKFMVKSVDPDATTTVTDSKKESEDEVISLPQEGAEEAAEQEEEEEYGDWVEEMTSPAPVILREEGLPSNRTDPLEKGAVKWGRRKRRRVFGTNTVVSPADRCLEPMAEGACSEYVLLWYFHPHSGECRPFVYGGCGGNRNQFSSRQECQSRCGIERRGGVVGQAGSQMRGQQGPSEGDHTGTIFRTLHHTNATVAGDSCVGVDVGAARIEACGTLWS